jgi:hypothetical protein
MLCPYKNIFGKLRQGPHSYRVFDIAIVDVVLTIIAAYPINKYLFPQYNYLTIMISLFILGIILHRLFCVRTTVDKLLFP